jgi:hypothetical protein
LDARKVRKISQKLFPCTPHIGIGFHPKNAIAVFQKQAGEDTCPEGYVRNH